MNSNGGREGRNAGRDGGSGVYRTRKRERERVLRQRIRVHYGLERESSCGDFASITTQTRLPPSPFTLAVVDHLQTPPGGRGGVAEARARSRDPARNIEGRREADHLWVIFAVGRPLRCSTESTPLTVLTIEHGRR